MVMAKKYARNRQQELELQRELQLIKNKVKRNCMLASSVMMALLISSLQVTVEPTAPKLPPITVSPTGRKPELTRRTPAGIETSPHVLAGLQRKGSREGLHNRKDEIPRTSKTEAGLGAPLCKKFAIASTVSTTASVKLQVRERPKRPLSVQRKDVFQPSLVRLQDCNDLQQRPTPSGSRDTSRAGERHDSAGSHTLGERSGDEVRTSRGAKVEVDMTFSGEEEGSGQGSPERQDGRSPLQEEGSEGLSPLQGWGGLSGFRLDGDLKDRRVDSMRSLELEGQGSCAASLQGGPKWGSDQGGVERGSDQSGMERGSDRGGVERGSDQGEMERGSAQGGTEGGSAQGGMERGSANSDIDLNYGLPRELQRPAELRWTSSIARPVPTTKAEPSSPSGRSIDVGGGRGGSVSEGEEQGAVAVGVAIPQSSDHGEIPKMLDHIPPMDRPSCGGEAPHVFDRASSADRPTTTCTPPLERQQDTPSCKDQDDDSSSDTSVESPGLWPKSCIISHIWGLPPSSTTLLVGAVGPGEYPLPETSGQHTSTQGLGTLQSSTVQGAVSNNVAAISKDVAIISKDAAVVSKDVQHHFIETGFLQVDVEIAVHGANVLTSRTSVGEGRRGSVGEGRRASVGALEQEGELDRSVGVQQSEDMSEDGPMERTPLEDGPMERTPLEDGPMERTPPDDGPMERSPVEDGPMERSPVEDSPMERTPLEDGPMERTPVEDGPMEWTPLEDGPMERTPVEDGLLQHTSSKDGLSGAVEPVHHFHGEIDDFCDDDTIGDDLHGNDLPANSSPCGGPLDNGDGSPGDDNGLPGDSSGSPGNENGLPGTGLPEYGSEFTGNGLPADSSSSLDDGNGFPDDGCDLLGSGPPGGGPSGNGLPGDGLLSDDLPGDGLQGDGLQDGLPGDGLPGDGLQGDDLPGDGLQGDGLPSDGIQGDGLPGDGLPGDGLPGDGLPDYGLPGDGTLPSEGNSSPCNHPPVDGPQGNCLLINGSPRGDNGRGGDFPPGNGPPGDVLQMSHCAIASLPAGVIRVIRGNTIPPTDFQEGGCSAVVGGDSVEAEGGADSVGAEGGGDSGCVRGGGDSGGGDSRGSKATDDHEMQIRWPQSDKATATSDFAVSYYFPSCR